MSSIKQLAIDIIEDAQFDIDVDTDVALVYTPSSVENPYIPSRSELMDDVL